MTEIQLYEIQNYQEFVLHDPKETWMFLRAIYSATEMNNSVVIIVPQNRLSKKNYYTQRINELIDIVVGQKSLNNIIFMEYISDDRDPSSCLEFIRGKQCDIFVHRLVELSEKEKKLCRESAIIQKKEFQ